MTSYSRTAVTIGFLASEGPILCTEERAKTLLLAVRGMGADGFVFSDLSQFSIIAGFEAGRGSEDIILRKVTTVTSEADLMESHIRQDG